MKLRLPSSLRSALLSCLSAAFVLTTGSGVLQAGEQELTFNGATLNWTTAPEDQVFTAADSSPAAFAPGDNVYFTGTTQVTLGEDIAVGILGVEAGAHVDITPGAYALEAERIELSGTLDYGAALHIGEGQTLAVESAGSVLDSALVLQDNGAVEVTAVANLNNNSLSMQGGTALSLGTTGDGRVYNLFTGVSSLLDAQGNTLVLNTTNNAVSNYFDTTRPGTGFWAGATLQLTTAGTLQLIRHSETVKAAVEFTTRQTGIEDYSYYDKVAFNDISSSSSGGAIYGSSNSTITLSDNGSVTFSENSASYGGAIYGDNIILADNSSVLFLENTVSADQYHINGGAIFGSTITLSKNGSVTFRGNMTSSGEYAIGGAIFGSTITLSKNGSVTFNGNSGNGGGYANGGAIYGSTITLNNNNSVIFSDNSATATYNRFSYAEAYGGAIYGKQITLSNNKSVRFSGNLSSAEDQAYGGAIWGSTITLSDNGSVTFSGNSATASASDGYDCAEGGAIWGSTITLSDNGSVTFSGNSSGRSANVYGGAIYGDTIILADNSSVLFLENNTVSSKQYHTNGGAIFGSTITLSKNGSVTFNGNSGNGGGYAMGGAICAISIIALCDNGSVTFSGNSATASASVGYAFVSGGAIGGSTITLSDNGSVTFSGNSATASASGNSATAWASDGDAYVYGGAIQGITITLSDNGSVTFSGNSATASASDGDAEAYGGAIYAYNLSIQNNDSVLFEKNAEITDGSYRLRSIYMRSTASDGGHFHLSAAAGKSIEFLDSVYIGSGATVELNADYTNSEGNVIKQEGDIIFTGAYAETHLNELLTAAEAGRTATAEEIANSRTSEMHGKVTLYGGTLRVEEQAVLKTTAGLDVAAGSNATVKVSNAELDAGSSDINVGDSGTLMLMNGATVKAANINIADGATFAVVEAPTQEAVATFSLREAASVAEPPQSCLVGANLTFEAGSTLVADGVYFSMTEGSTLTFKALTGGDKINLVLTLGAEYDDSEQVVLFSDADVVRFILDGVELNATDSILASTFFTGAWVNDETTLSYDSSSGTISVQHLNTVCIPEPTTATLSLLALAALAARRRRK